MNHTNQNQNRIDEHQIEEGSQLLLDFAKLAKISESVLPVIVQHFTSKEVLILAYVNQEAFSKSIELGQAVFYSTSRKKLWHKGSTSGDYLTLKEIRVNCEQNSLLFLVDPVKKGVCHTKDTLGQTRPTCYYRRLENDELKFVELAKLQ